MQDKDDVIGGAVAAVLTILVLALAFLFGAMFQQRAIADDCESFGMTTKIGDGVYECREMDRTETTKSIARDLAEMQREMER